MRELTARRAPVHSAGAVFVVGSRPVNTVAPATVPFRLRSAAAFLLLIVSTPALAGPWDDGMNAFTGGDYARALEAFTRAREDGSEGPAVDYNIAVCLYRLERYAEADFAFRELGRRYDAFAGLAEYNQGLVADRLGDAPDARRHFLSAYRLSPDDRNLRILASTMLRRIEPDWREDAGNAGIGWRGATGLRLGVDDNVALIDELGLPAGVSADSPMVDAFLQLESPSPAGDGIRLDTGAYVVRYTEAGDFDQSGLRGRLAYEWNAARYSSALGVQVAAGTLGGDAFDRRAGINARFLWFMAGDASLDLRLEYESIDAGRSALAGIEGKRRVADLRYRWSAGPHRWSLRWANEDNDRDSAGVSAARNLVGVDYRYSANTPLGYRIGVEYRRSDFDDLEPARREDLLTLRLGASYALSDAWFLSADLLFSDNDSSDPLYAYDRSVATVGALFVF